MSGTGGHINLGASDEFLSESLFQLPSSTWRPSSLQSTLYLPTGSALFLLPSPTPTTLFLGFVDLVLKVFSFEVSDAAIWLLRLWSGMTCLKSELVLDCQPWMHSQRLLSLRMNSFEVSIGDWLGKKDQ